MLFFQVFCSWNLRTRGVLTFFYFRTQKRLRRRRRRQQQLSRRAWRQK